MEECHSFFRPALWKRFSNAALSDNRGTFIITHPFSPLKGKEFKLVERRSCWGEDRLLSFDENGDTCLILTSWTDYLPPDPFVSISNGRADFRYEDLACLKETLLMTEEKLSIQLCQSVNTIMSKT
ncbi:DUF5372 family protein [Novisyntrophococcus fermenticellae]|uniref:DUF5372 family protein n=1 Tax=Novisyntrophococcus fermenticellae TaxID=2068655 RepID=UPI0038CD3C8C